MTARTKPRRIGERRETGRRCQTAIYLAVGPLCSGLGHLWGLLLLSVRLIGGVVGRRPLNSSPCKQRRRGAPIAVAELRSHSNAGNFCLILFTAPCTSRRIYQCQESCSQSPVCATLANFAVALVGAAVRLMEGGEAARAVGSYSTVTIRSQGNQMCAVGWPGSAEIRLLHTYS